MIVPKAVYWDNRTVFFYVFISLLAFFLSNSLILKVKFVKKKREIPCGLIIVTLLLILIKGCSGVGRDLITGYQNDFLNSANFNSFPDKTVEIGYKILNIILFNIFHNYNIFLIIISILTVLPVSCIAWENRKIFDVNIVMGLYVSIWYFQSFSLIRIYLASSLALIAFQFEMKNKPLKSLLWILIAVSFHTAAIVLILPWFIQFGKIFSTKIHLLLIIILFVCIFIFRQQIISLFTGRYEAYRLAPGDIGFQEIIYYLPIFLIIYFGHKYSKSEDNLYSISNGYVFSGFGLGILKYAITILGRLQSLFLPLAFIISHYYSLIKKNKLSSFVIKLLIIIYGLVRLIIYLQGYYDLDDIMPYSTFWGWII